MSLVVPELVGTIGTGILGGLASGTCWDVPCNPSTSWDCRDWDLRGSSLWDLLGCPCSPSTSWDCRDWDSSGSSLLDLLGCPMQSQHFLGLLGLGF